MVIKSASSTSLIRNNIETKIGQSLTEEEFAYFEGLLRYKEISPKEALIRERDLCSTLYFVEKGALCSFLTDSVGDAHVVQFAFEDHWITDVNSYHLGKPALFTVESLEYCQLLALDRAGFQAACHHSPKFERFFRVLVQNAYAAALYRLARNFSADAETRYCELVEQQPKIVQRVPQFLVASYLGIKPQSLSRIRKQIFEKR